MCVRAPKKLMPGIAGFEQIISRMKVVMTCWVESILLGLGCLARQQTKAATGAPPTHVPPTPALLPSRHPRCSFPARPSLLDGPAADCAPPTSTVTSLPLVR